MGLRTGKEFSDKSSNYSRRSRPSDKYSRTNAARTHPSLPPPSPLNDRERRRRSQRRGWRRKMDAGAHDPLGTPIGLFIIHLFHSVADQSQKI
ncbi:hypothetical protein CEXT_263771 [Caerostris extrusa]|uniref:Uncharacterized protein n=1 Tax=Caerostris extrusa TaxID=172846 RepID=A0AAV4QAA3_CAEEX|nr:hypothetical protein CEXT_263771 [Caerostris extrusa]